MERKLNTTAPANSARGSRLWETWSRATCGTLITLLGETTGVLHLADGTTKHPRLINPNLEGSVVELKDASGRSSMKPGLAESTIRETESANDGTVQL
jgi:hypothetical protein